MSHKNPGAGCALKGHLALCKAPRESGSLSPVPYVPRVWHCPRPHQELNAHMHPGCSLAHQALPPRTQNQRHPGVLSIREMFFLSATTLRRGPPLPCRATGSSSSPCFTRWGQKRENGGRVTVTGAGPGQVPGCWWRPLRHLGVGGWGVPIQVEVPPLLPLLSTPCL